MPTPLPPLSDPESVESELGASDFARPVPTPRPKDEDIVSLVEGRFQSAANARRYHDGSVFLSLAFFLGEQHLGWSINTQRLVDSRNMEQSWRLYSTRNKIKPKILKLQARALEAQPDASFRPAIWDNEMDRLAAQEARAVRAHLNSVHHEDQQLAEEVLWAMTTSTVCRKYSWDPTALAEVPGETEGSPSVWAPVGEVSRETVPIVDLYPDPKARITKGMISRCGWIIHSHVVDLAEVQTRYGDAALALDGEAASGQDGYIESRMASIVGDQQATSEMARKSAVVIKELWEKPSARYPDGRLITIGGGRVLRYDEKWPCKKRDTFPFVPLSFVNGPGSFYGLNAVYDLIGAQRTYNRAVTAMDQYLEHPWGKWLVPRGAEIGADALNDPREAVYHTPGFKPEYQPPPPVADVISRALVLSDADIGDLSGVHDVSDGEAPKDVTAASALEILKQQDASQMRQFLTNLSTFVVECAEWEIALAAENYAEPRLLAVDDLTEGKEAARQVLAFRGLTNGGSCHVSIEPGSSAPLSAVSRLQLVQQLFQQGFFGQPGDPNASLMALEMMDEVRSDPLIERLEQMRKAATAKAEQDRKDQQQQAQQEQQSKAQQQQQGQQGDQQMTVLKAHLQQAMTQIQNAQAQQHQAEMKAVQLHADLSQQQVTHAHDIEKLAMQHKHEQSNVRVSLSGTLTPPETAQAFGEAEQANSQEANSQEQENHNALPNQAQSPGGQSPSQNANEAQDAGGTAQESIPSQEADAL
jgi:hypothetical protein